MIFMFVNSRDLELVHVIHEIFVVVNSRDFSWTLIHVIYNSFTWRELCPWFHVIRDSRDFKRCFWLKLYFLQAHHDICLWLFTHFSCWLCLRHPGSHLWKVPCYHMPFETLPKEEVHVAILHQFCHSLQHSQVLWTANRGKV